MGERFCEVGSSSKLIDVAMAAPTGTASPTESIVARGRISPSIRERPATTTAVASITFVPVGNAQRGEQRPAGGPVHFLVDALHALDHVRVRLGQVAEGALHHHVGVADDDVERRAQLVRHGRHELGLEPCGLEGRVAGGRHLRQHAEMTAHVVRHPDRPHDPAAGVAERGEPLGQGLLQDAARVYVRIGSQLEGAGRAQEGVAYFQRAVALVPNDPQSKIALFGVSLAGGNLEEAMQTARDLVTSSLAAKDYDTARTVAEKGVAAAPQDLGMRVSLAKAYHGLGLTSLRDETVKHIHKNLPVDQGEAGRILVELQALTAPGPMTKAIRLAAAKRRGRRKWAIPAGVAVGAWLQGRTQRAS